MSTWGNCAPRFKKKLRLRQIDHLDVDARLQGSVPVQAYSSVLACSGWWILKLRWIEYLCSCCSFQRQMPNRVWTKLQIPQFFLFALKSKIFPKHHYNVPQIGSQAWSWWKLSFFSLDNLRNFLLSWCLIVGRLDHRLRQKNILIIRQLMQCPKSETMT